MLVVHDESSEKTFELYVPTKDFERFPGKDRESYKFSTDSNWFLIPGVVLLPPYTQVVVRMIPL